MLDTLFTNPLSFLIWLVALLVAITIHEFSHAWTADRLGDPTARLMGRLTLNPLAHLDPFGTLALLLFRFGWGKPVPFDPFNLRNPRRDAALISLAGPASNLILATLLSLLLRFLSIFNFPASPAGGSFLIFNLFIEPIIALNVMLGVFNLLPVHPLDGGKILIGFLPQKQAEEWDQILSQYSLLIILFLLFPFFGFSLVSLIVSPIINFILWLLLPGTPLL
ncbi:MAG: site-2 protease family protein [Patescibacteria group bacterium]